MAEEEAAGAGAGEGDVVEEEKKEEIIRTRSTPERCLASVEGGIMGNFGSPQFPTDCKLIQPSGRTQILFYEHASCLAVETYLHMLHLQFDLGSKKNVEFISPTGFVPVFKIGTQVIAEFDPIIAFCHNKGVSLSTSLDEKQKGEMRKHMSNITNTLMNAELYISWIDETTLENVTWPRYGSVFPFPLNLILTSRKKRQIEAKLKEVKWNEKNIEEVFEDMEDVISNLSDALGNKNYFFGKPTELDALVFGHMFALMTTHLPDTVISDIVGSYPNLVDFCQRIEQEYFQN